jgi:8-oxo-dGTP pyrophosphatase MutT (NUDIX family)
MNSRKRRTGPTFVSGGGRLHPSDAAVAILVLEDGRYVMQLRDDIPGIFYPGHWGCFGGAIDPGESAVAALKRELMEELEFRVRPGRAARFTRFQYDLKRFGRGKIDRQYFEVTVTPEEYGRFVLHEGKSFRAFAGSELLCQRWITPYDAFAIWMHYRQSCLSG